jgi:predicted nucleotidyltransferase
MTRKHRTPANARPARWYRGADIPMRVIRLFARRVAEKFQPDKIILFGSYAYGTPHADSDVDLLVIMPARNELDQAFKIRCEVPTQFPMDLLVLKPRNVQWRLEERESFLTEIMAKGKILYEKDHPRMGAQSGGRLSSGRNTRRETRALP